MPQLDGVRAFAIALVLAQHTWTYRFFQFGRNGVGIWGVWLFFVLSGFLITGILLRARDDAPSVGAAMKRFYARRVIRIFPLYYVVLILGAALGIGVSFRQYFPWHFFYLTNWHVAITGRWFDSEASPLWSLAIEEQFYLVWPLLVLLAPRHRLRSLFVGTACVGILSRVVLAVAGFNDHAAQSVLQPTTSNLDPLAWGALLAWARWSPSSVSDASIRRWTRLALGVGLVLFFAVLVCTAVARGERLLLVCETLSAGLLSVWLVERASAGFAPRSLAGRLLTMRPVRYLGTISYGMYLLHSPILWVLHFRLGRDFKATNDLGASLGYWVLLTAITAVVASASWFWFERPINRLKDRFPTRTAAPGANVPAPTTAIPA